MAQYSGAAAGGAGGGRGQGWRTFDAAQRYMRSLNIVPPTRDGWRAWKKTGARPKDIPGMPDQEYEGKGWAGWADFLGEVPTTGACSAQYVKEALAPQVSAASTSSPAQPPTHIPTAQSLPKVTAPKVGGWSAAGLVAGMTGRTGLAYSYGGASSSAATAAAGATAGAATTAVGAFGGASGMAAGASSAGSSLEVGESSLPKRGMDFSLMADHLAVLDASYKVTRVCVVWVWVDGELW
jgi:hypothetical protein